LPGAAPLWKIGTATFIRIVILILMMMLAIVCWALGSDQEERARQWVLVDKEVVDKRVVDKEESDMGG
jgi:nitrogen fixation-related uncharacterized protein